MMVSEIPSNPAHSMEFNGILKGLKSHPRTGADRASQELLQLSPCHGTAPLAQNHRSVTALFNLSRGKNPLQPPGIHHFMSGSFEPVKQDRAA